jgi:hypothetical protein
VPELASRAIVEVGNQHDIWARLSGIGEAAPADSDERVPSQLRGQAKNLPSPELLGCSLRDRSEEDARIMVARRKALVRPTQGIG